MRKKFALLSFLLFFVFLIAISISFSHTGLFSFSNFQEKTVDEKNVSWKMFGKIQVVNGTIVEQDFLE